MRKGLLLAAAIVLLSSTAGSKAAMANDETPAYPEGYWDFTGDERIPLIQQMIEENEMCWTAGPTSVSNLPDEEKHRLLGGRPDPFWGSNPDPFPSTLTERELPAVFDWRAQLKCTDTRSQGSCGSCWLFGPVAAFEAAAMIYDDRRLDLSEQQILSCVSYGWGCGGGWSSDALSHMVTYGSVLESCMPYRAIDTWPCTEDDCEVWPVLDNYYSVANDVTAIKNAIYTYGPVTTGFWVFDDFNYYSDGCYDADYAHSTNHIMSIVGWDDTQCDGDGAWIIKNSWGTGWGMNGYVYVKYGVASVGRSVHRLAYTPQLHFLRFGDYAVDAGAKGNGNGFLDPGETAQLSVTLVNDGQGPATGISGILRTETAGVTVTDSTADFSDIPSETSGSTIAPHFEISIDGGFSEGDWIEFELALETDTYSSATDFVVYVGEFTEVLTDDFETDQGWTVGELDDDATEGIWERVEPVEKLALQYQGERVQPGLDTTPYSGTMCFVTENSPLGTKQRFGDVDGGKTTVLSPILDLSDYGTAVLKYERFYTNDTIPTQTDDDPFEVDVSNDGGDNWTNLETVTETPGDREYHRMIFELSGVVTLTDQMQIRFVAKDVGAYNSVVEAAVDDIEVLGFGDMTEAAAGGPWVRKPASLVLTQNVPNPFNPETMISFGLPNAATVDLSIYNIRGQRVRQLLDGRLPAGFHSARWDGRDANGLRVSSGVYFYRLSTPEGCLTRRMTLIK